MIYLLLPHANYDPLQRSIMANWRFYPLCKTWNVSTVAQFLYIHPLINGSFCPWISPFNDPFRPNWTDGQASSVKFPIVVSCRFDEHRPIFLLHYMSLFVFFLQARMTCLEFVANVSPWCGTWRHYNSSLNSVFKITLYYIH